MGTRIALTLLSTETIAGHCRKNEHRRGAGRMQDLETIKIVAVSIPTETGEQMGTRIVQTILFSNTAVGHCREGQQSQFACGWKEP